jgi:hypothetical protein
VPRVPPVYLKRLEWVCDWCDNYEEEIKEEETGFITVDELIRLQRAGFNRPRDV